MKDDRGPHWSYGSEGGELCPQRLVETRDNQHQDAAGGRQCTASCKLQEISSRLKKRILDAVHEFERRRGRSSLDWQRKHAINPNSVSRHTQTRNTGGGATTVSRGFFGILSRFKTFPVCFAPQSNFVVTPHYCQTVLVHIRPARVWLHDTRHACCRHMALSAQNHGSVPSSCVCRRTSDGSKTWMQPAHVSATLLFPTGFP